MKRTDKSASCGILVPCEQTISIGCKAIENPMTAPLYYRPPEEFCRHCVCYDCARKNCGVYNNLKKGVVLPKYDPKAHPETAKISLRDTSQRIPL